MTHLRGSIKSDTNLQMIANRFAKAQSFQIRILGGISGYLNLKTVKRKEILTIAFNLKSKTKIDKLYLNLRNQLTRYQLRTMTMKKRRKKKMNCRC